MPVSNAPDRYSAVCTSFTTCPRAQASTSTNCGSNTSWKRGIEHSAAQQKKNLSSSRRCPRSSFEVHQSAEPILARAKVSFNDSSFLGNTYTISIKKCERQHHEMFRMLVRGEFHPETTPFNNGRLSTTCNLQRPSIASRGPDTAYVMRSSSDNSTTNSPSSPPSRFPWPPGG